MRGDEEQQAAMFNLERRVPAEHPLRAVRQMADQALGDLSAHLTRCTRAEEGPRYLPSNCCGALLLQVLYGLRSERQLMEQVDFNLLLARLFKRGRTQRSGVRHQPEETQTGGDGIWLGQS